MSWSLKIAARSPEMLASKVKLEAQKTGGDGMPPALAEFLAGQAMKLQARAPEEGVGLFIASTGHLYGGTGAGTFEIGYGVLPVE